MGPLNLLLNGFLKNKMAGAWRWHYKLDVFTPPKFTHVPHSLRLIGLQYTHVYIAFVNLDRYNFLTGPHSSETTSTHGLEGFPYAYIYNDNLHASILLDFIRGVYWIGDLVFTKAIMDVMILEIAAVE